MKRIPIAAVALLLAVGCATNQKLAYTPSAPAQGAFPVPSPAPGDIPGEPVVGVGLQVRAGNGDLLVVRAIEGNPAAKAGIREGDSIVFIDGRSTRGEEPAAAVGRIRGVKGTPVTLGVMRAGWRAERAFTLVRDILQDGASATPPREESIDETIEGILKGK